MLEDVTAVVLCGGKGERLRPFTETMPKPMVPLNGHPLLYYLLKQLHEAGVARFVLCVGYKAEVIEKFVADDCPPEWDVTCVNSGDASMTERIIDARSHFEGPALICYGDTLANINLKALRGEQRASGALATLTVYPLRSPFGLVTFTEGKKVTGFSEKPHLPYWINIGYLLCEAPALDRLERGSDMPSFLSGLAREGLLTVHQHQDKHITVNTEKERASAESEVIEFFTLLGGGDYGK